MSAGSAAGQSMPFIAAIAENVVRLGELLADAPVGIAFVDRDLRFLSVNAMLAASNQRSVEAHAGRTIAEVAPGIWHLLEPICRKVLQGETVRGAELLDDRGPGDAKHWIVHYFPLRGAGDAQPQGIGIVVQDDTERRSTEIERQKIVQLVSHSGDFIAMADLQGRVEYMNPAARAMAGLPPGAPLGQPFDAHLSPEARALSREEVMPVVHREGHWSGELQVMNTGTGQRIDVHSDVFAVRDPSDHRPIGYGTVARDMTGAREAERALRESQRRLDLALNAAEIGLFEWDLDTERGAWSRHHYLIFGYPPGSGEVTREHFESRVWPEDLLRYRSEMADALAGRRTFETEYRIRLPNGETRTISSSANFDVAEEGQSRRMTGVVIDITDRRAATAELARRERQFASLMANSPDLFARFDRALRYTYASPALERLVGLAPADALGLEPFVRARWESALRRVFNRGRPDRFAFEWTREGSGTRHHEARLIPERAESGEVESVLAIVTDVTDRYLAEQALRDADKRKDEFLATLAHELRNPLAPLRNGLELLSQPADAATTAKVGAMMQRQLQQLVHLVDDLLDVGRITRGRLTLRRQPVLLSAVVDNVLEVSRPMIEAAGHELVLDLPRLQLQLDADPTRLAQIITNLLNNAARYTPGGGRIELAFKAEGNNLEITVRDNGVGIPRSMLDRVFDLFTQAEPGMGQAQGGLGIGLTLVKRLVEMHGGRVSAHSGGPGQGSCFQAVLPVVLAQADRPTPQPAEPVATALQAGPHEPEPAARPLSVLVVDDNRDSAETLALVLELAGHRVATAHDGTHALALANAGAPEVAVLDIGLPDMTGHDLARRLRALPGGAQMLLVAVTGWGQAQDRNRSVAAGFDHHLVKPVDPAQLEALLATHRREG